MKLKIYTIFDRKALAFAQPFFLVNDDVAKRSFQMAVKDPQSQIADSPHDYELLCIGMWDDQDGEIESETAFPIMSGTDAVRANARFEQYMELPEQKQGA